MLRTDCPNSDVLDPILLIAMGRFPYTACSKLVNIDCTTAITWALAE
jgi:hypothetical protein